MQLPLRRVIFPETLLFERVKSVWTKWSQLTLNMSFVTDICVTLVPSDLTGISSILFKTQCDCSVLEDALGSSAGITENNIMSYMSLVEQKTIELLAIRAYLDSKVTSQLVALLLFHSFQLYISLFCFFFFFFQDVEKDYNPKELAKSLLGQYPKLLKQDIIIEPTDDRSIRFCLH